MNKIYLYIAESVEIEKYINKVVPYQYRKDIMSHLILEVSKMDYDMLINALNDGTLKYKMFKVIKNQMDPNCSNCFHRINISKYTTTTTTDMWKSNVYFDFKHQDVQDTNFDYIFKDNDLSTDRLEKIEKIIRRLKPWKVELFNLYYKDELNYREIGEKLKINDRTVQRWVSEVLNDIKKELLK